MIRLKIIITVFLIMNGLTSQDISAQVFPWLNGSSSSSSRSTTTTRPPLNSSKPWNSPPSRRPAARVAVTPAQQNIPWKYKAPVTKKTGKIITAATQRSSGTRRPVNTASRSSNTVKAYPWNPHLLPPKGQAAQASTSVYRQPAVNNYPSKITPKSSTTTSYSNNNNSYNSTPTYTTPSPIARPPRATTRDNYVEYTPPQPQYQSPPSGRFPRNTPPPPSSTIKKAQPSPWLANTTKKQQSVTTPPAPISTTVVVPMPPSSNNSNSNVTKAKVAKTAPWLGRKGKKKKKKNRKAAPVYTNPQPTIVIESQPTTPKSKRDAFAPTPVKTVPLNTYPSPQQPVATNNKPRIIRPSRKQKSQPVYQSPPVYNQPSPAIVINTPKQQSNTRPPSGELDIFAPPPPASKDNSPQDRGSYERPPSNNTNNALTSPSTDEWIGDEAASEEDGLVDVTNIRGTKFLDKAELKARMNYFHDGSWESLLKRAKKEKRYFFVDFMTDWCRVCKEMEHATFADFDVRNTVESRFIAYQLNGEKRADIAKKFKVAKYPTLLFFDQHGQEIGRREGFLSKSTFMTALAEFKAKVPHTRYTEFR